MLGNKYCRQNEPIVTRKKPFQSTHHLHNFPRKVSGPHRYTKLWRTLFTFLFRRRIPECVMGAFTAMAKVKVKVKQFLVRPGQVLRVAGSSGTQISWQSVHECGKVVSLKHRPPLSPQGIFLIFISVWGWVEPRAIVRPEGLCQWETPTTPSGVETHWTKHKSNKKIEEKEVSTKGDRPSAAGRLITVSTQNKLTFTLEMLQEILICLAFAISCHSVAHWDEEKR